jgi:Fe-S cluster assembly iron-binding protein IscA
MLNVTDKATAVLRTALDESTREEQHVLRIERSGDNLTLRIDEKRDGDQVVSDGGGDLLVVEPQVSDALDGATLDAVDSDQGARLVLKGRG